MEMISHIKANWYYYLRNLNYTEAFICLLISFFLLYFLLKTKRSQKASIIYISTASVYIIVLLSITIFGREKLEEGMFADMTSTINLLFEGDKNVFYDVLFNVILFIPMGFLLSKQLRVLSSCITILCSTFCIEIIQDITHRGRFECVDIVTNFIGGIIGIGLYYLFRILIRFIRTKWIERKTNI